MTSQQFCPVTTTVRIPLSELSFTFSRARGSGGQHVNKVNTRVTLWFDINASQSLSEEQKQRIRQRLAGRINRQGVLFLHADRRRSQHDNREDVLQRFADLLRTALHRDRPRRRTRPGRGAKERRLQAKKQRSRIKAQRSKKNFTSE